MILPLRELVGIPVDPSIIARNWPKLTTDVAELKSDPDPFYNCAAFAADVTDNKWWPIDIEGYYWPPGFPLDNTTETILATFETVFGFERCADGSVEDGFEKIAVYELDGEPEHVAKQATDGKWMCKMGGLDDIEYDTLSVLEGPLYGKPAGFARRAIR